MTSKIFEEFMTRRFGKNAFQNKKNWESWKQAFSTGDPEFYMSAGEQKIYKELRAKHSSGKPKRYFYGVEVKEEELPPMLTGNW